MDRGELGAAAEIFQAAFAHEHASRYREGARANSFLHVWSFLHELEPESFLAAREDGRLVGYAIFVPSLRRVQWEALRSGALLRWSLIALRGGFGLRLSAVWRVLMNKIMFLRSGGRYRSKGDAQLINIAVLPEAQGRGIAKALVREGLRVMRMRGVPEVRLEVRPWNHRAVRLYENTGWRQVGQTRDLEGEWLVMVANP